MLCNLVVVAYSALEPNNPWTTLGPCHRTRVQFFYHVANSFPPSTVCCMLNCPFFLRFIIKKTECLVTTSQTTAIVSFLHDVVRGVSLSPGFCHEVDRRGYQVPPLGPWKGGGGESLAWTLFLFRSHCLLRSMLGWWWVDEELHLDAGLLSIFIPLRRSRYKTPHQPQSRFYPLSLSPLSPPSFYSFLFSFLFFGVCRLFTSTCLFF